MGGKCCSTVCATSCWLGFLWLLDLRGSERLMERLKSSIVPLCRWQQLL